MASNGNDRGGLLTAGGILSIVGGAFEVISGVIMVVLTIGTRILLRLALLPFHPGDWFERIIPVIPFWLIIVGVPIIVLGIIAIVGGVSALRRKMFGLSLAGAICALPSHILGILAIIFVSLSKKEFEAKE
ncbi:MAG: hypothetical protein MUP49_03870 [Dehalococcoidia bacterium]|jgi:hypothetical protein|nr:hypothetical protein [Dehalococcoidia bacterium]